VKKEIKLNKIIKNILYIGPATEFVMGYPASALFFLLPMELHQLIHRGLLGF
jgi:hypothetical protein